MYELLACDFDVVVICDSLSNNFQVPTFSYPATLSSGPSVTCCSHRAAAHFTAAKMDPMDYSNGMLEDSGPKVNISDVSDCTRLFY
jgi:hypothetical protein